MAQTLVMMLEKAKGLTNSFQSPPQIVLATHPVGENPQSLTRGHTPQQLSQ